MYLSATSLETKSGAMEKTIRKMSRCDSGHHVLVLSFVGETRFLEVI